jgi:lipocalin
MKIELQELEGRWYINQSNFPMWLKGDKTKPTLNYTLQEKGGKKGLLDAVEYEQNGKAKSIQGFDSILDAHNTKFLWRGKGLLSLLTSEWSILHLAPSQEWALIYFKKTLFTPKGYDVISRSKTLSTEQIQAVDQQLKNLGIQVDLQVIKQENNKT